MSYVLMRRKGMDFCRFTVGKSAHMASTHVGDTTLCGEVIIKTISDKAVITLNRPKSLNSLTLPMIKTINPFMKEWQSKGDLKMIIIKGAGEKAFCAGGDVRAVSGSNLECQKTFFQEEYFLNHAIGMSKVPWVALIDGITMGGGAGLSVHGNFRVATERTLFAMPETAIGLIPDVGGGHFLPRLLGGLGNFLALTGFRLKGRDTFNAGIATHFVESSKIAHLEKDLLRLVSPSLEDIKEILDHYHDETILEKDKPFVLSSQQSLINDIFSSYNIEDILNGLSKDGSDWSKAQLETLAKMSPTSLKLTLEQMRRGKNMSLKQDLEMEYRIVIRIMQKNDFSEGVRALLIDKDLKPCWKPSSLKEVSNSVIESYFEELPLNEELVL